jgi:hypothetical protein
VAPPSSKHTVYGLGDLHLPPGRGNISLKELFRRIDFPEKPSCCVELAPEFFPLIPGALNTARELALVVAVREHVTV